MPIYYTRRYISEDRNINVRTATSPRETFTGLLKGAASNGKHNSADKKYLEIFSCLYPASEQMTLYYVLTLLL